MRSAASIEPGMNQSPPTFLQPIRSPSGASAVFLSWLAGLGILTFLIITLSVISFFKAPSEQMAQVEGSRQWLILVVGVVLSVPLHEMLHLAWYPAAGTSEKSKLLIQPSKLRFGVYHEGCIPRWRWLAMRASPLLCLVALPALLLAAGPATALPAAFVLLLQIVMLVNSVGSGADLVAITYVLNQVPASGRICFIAGKAYWRSNT